MRGKLFEGLTKAAQGRQVTVFPGETKSIIRVFGDDHDAEVLTVVLNLEPTQTLSAGTNFAAIGILSWGIGGQQNQAEVDFMHGAMVSVPASYLEVSVRNDETLELNVSASVGYGSRGGSSVPTAFRTLQFRAANLQAPASPPSASFTDEVTIPRWAAVGIVVYDPPTASITLSVVDRSNVVMFQRVNPAIGESFPILNGSRTVRITNTSSPPTLLTRVLVQFALVL
jgi:hypothetical protein